MTSIQRMFAALRGSLYWVVSNKKRTGVLLCIFGLMTALPAHAQLALTADGLVESTSGGFMFPDGTVQTTSALPGGPYAIGAGARNTAAIVLAGCQINIITPASSSAGVVADQLLLFSSGYFDWHLPTRFDLNLMWILLHLSGAGDFCGTCTYWSSTESISDTTKAWSQDFSTGVMAFSDKSDFLKVRAVRTF